MSTQFEDLSQSDLIIDEVYESNGAKNSGGDVLCKLMKVGSLGGFRKRLRTDIPNSIAYIALETTLKEIDWIDSIDLESGIITYFGDNRNPGHELHDTPLKGNTILRDCFLALFSGERDNIPPFFYFVSAGGRDRRFVGLAVPGANALSHEKQLVAVWRSKNQQRYQNYKAIFTILDVAKIERQWLQDLIAGNGFASEHAPMEWKRWISTGRAKPLQATKITSYRSKDEQLPATLEGMELLKKIYAYFSNKYCFEACAIKLSEMMDSNIHNCQHTRFVKDGGRDAIGSYSIGRQADGINVEFALEAKCYCPGKTEVGVKEISRLISRLRFRQFGILVTTSVVGKQAYQELREDQHPVIIVCGRDIINILYSAGIKTTVEVEKWLSQFDSQ